MNRSHPPHGPVLRREWRAVALFALFILTLTTIPYGAGLAAQTDQARFGGFMFGVEDGNSYLAKMRQGANGEWLYSLAYTPGPTQGALFFLPYLVGGKLAALIVPPTHPEHTVMLLIVFQAARLVFGFGLILVCYRFVAEFVKARRLRWFAILLVCLGGGFGWLLVLIGRAQEPNVPIDFILPEGYSFYVLYGLPHLALARIGLLMGLLQTMRALETPKWPRRMGYASLWWLVMGLCVPFYTGILIAILGAWGVALWLLTRRFPLDLFKRCVVGVLLPGAFLVYLLIVYATVPVWKAFNEQNALPSPSPIHYLFGYGLYLVPALIAWLTLVRRKRIAQKPGIALLVSWLRSSLRNNPSSAN